MEFISSYWHQILFLVGAIVVAVRLQSEVHSLRKDIEDIKKRDTYVEVVNLEQRLMLTSNKYHLCGSLLTVLEIGLRMDTTNGRE